MRRTCSCLFPAALGLEAVGADVTYIDAVEGAGGNTLATGVSLADPSWVGPDAASASATQWKKRTSAKTAGKGTTVFQAATITNLPEPATRITGRANGMPGRASLRSNCFFKSQAIPQQADSSAPAPLATSEARK